MLTSGIAAAVMLGVLLLGALLASASGFLVCRTWRLTWSLTIAAQDAGLALIVELATTIVGLIMSRIGGKLDSGVMWIALAAVGSVVSRHVIWRRQRAGGRPA